MSRYASLRHPVTIHHVNRYPQWMAHSAAHRSDEEALPLRHRTAD